METVLIWMTGALAGGYAFKLLSLPTSAGFIVAGYVLALLNFSQNTEYLTLPAEIGVGLLLFSIGLKVKPSYFYNRHVIFVFIVHSIVVTLFFYFLLHLDVGLEIKLGLCVALSAGLAVVHRESREETRTDEMSLIVDQQTR